MFGQVPVGNLLVWMEMGFLEMESLTSQNQFLLGLVNNFGLHNSLVETQINPKFSTEMKWAWKDIFNDDSNLTREKDWVRENERKRERLSLTIL